MGLKAYRQVYQRNKVDFDHPRTSERGGVLTVYEASGIYYADYSIDPSGKAILGIKANDNEWIELQRQRHPGRLRNVEEYMGPADIITKGDVITDWVHSDFGSLIGPGQKAYVGPSGTLVNDDSYGGKCVGVFLSTVNSVHFGLNKNISSHVLFEGMGLEYVWTDPDTKEIEHVNPYKTRIPVAGWVLLRVRPGYKWY